MTRPGLGEPSRTTLIIMVAETPDGPQMVEILDSPGVEILDVDFEQEVITTTYEITSYGADYDVFGLVRRMSNGDVFVPSFDPDQGTEEVSGFQRGYVWQPTQRSRFIESLLLGLPVPGIFLIRDRQNHLLVLDGQQRLRTLQAFYAGILGDKKFRLVNVQAPFNGLAYEDLDAEDRRRLDDSIIHATVLRQESSSGTQDAVYSIYERLNTGGSPLQPQEIRIALFPGDFLRGIGELARNDHWRNLYGPSSPRYRDHELILRVLALYENQAGYSRPLKAFLNDYLEVNKDRQLHSDSDLGEVFAKAIDVIDSAVGKPAYRPERAVNAAFVDAITVGVMRRVAHGGAPDPAALKAAFDSLVAGEDFRSATFVNTSQEEAVASRLNLATQAFAAV